MSAPAILETDRTYKNPVYPRSFPDPFVLKHGRDYFAYCTGIHDDGRVFATLHSTDLVHWRELGGAMTKLHNDAPFYWAPEVTSVGGRFFLYYSVGNETLMELRLAVSGRPQGGFEDVGVRLTSEEFAIDPHVFIDDDGQRYMFYATDFLEHTHVGTGTVVDRMLDWDKLEGAPRPVTRAKYDWQVYDPERKEKGGVRWHTVEGPFVIKRKGRYFEMFSGGNWQNTSYGVSFATSDEIVTDREWQQFSDGEKTLPIIRTTPDVIVGPGHNSVVRGPNGRELYCVYHRWTDAGRVMAIDRMDFAGERIFVNGPTDDVQPAPFRPRILRKSELSRNENGSYSLEPLPIGALCEFRIRSTGDTPGGFELWSGEEKLFDYFPDRYLEGAGGRPSEIDRVVSVDVSGRHLCVSIDGIASKSLGGMLTSSPDRLTIYALAGDEIAVTEGFEELFEGDNDLTETGWQIDGDVVIDNCELTLNPAAGGGSISRAWGPGEFDLAVNLRVEMPGEAAEFGVGIVGPDGSKTVFGYIEGALRIDGPNFRPEALGPDIGSFALARQIRFTSLKESTLLYLDGDLIASAAAPLEAAQFEVFCRGTSLVLDMVRLTRLDS
jgi:GH43 family beta-xylosidase